jgi:hypothetical protein
MSTGTPIPEHLAHSAIGKRGRETTYEHTYNHDRVMTSLFDDSVTFTWNEDAPDIQSLRAAALESSAAR